MFGVGVWEIIFIIIPISILIVLPFWKIFSKAGFSGWWSLFILIPPINIFLIYYFAFSKWRFSEKITEIDHNDIDPMTGNGVTTKIIVVKSLFIGILLCLALFLILFQFNNEDSLLTKILDNFNVGLYQPQCSANGCIIMNTSNGIYKVLGEENEFDFHPSSVKADF